MRLLPAVLLASLAPCLVFSQTYTIKTFAGGGLPVNIAGTSASLGLTVPQDVAADGAGNLFFVDRNTVLRLDATSGVLTLAAGNGTYGFSGDNGPATSAQLSQPFAVAADSVGNFYIADLDNFRIRKVSNGVITTVAGNGTGGYGGDNGPATSAQLAEPDGLAVDSSGNLYIADANGSVVRKVSGGVITTVAGNGTPGFSGDNGPATSAQLNAPSGIAVDFAGNLYIADRLNQRIRKVSNGVITTVAGNGTGGFSGDNGSATSAQLNVLSGVAVDSAGSLYIADNLRIRKVSNGVITTVAGNGTGGFSGDGGLATSAQLSHPTGVAVDSAGNLYIADEDNNRIRKISNGVITTVAGNGTCCFSGDNGPATSAQLFGPYSPNFVGVAVDSAGSLYIADTGNSRIREVSSGVITTVAGNGTGGFSGDGGLATSAQLAYPWDVAVDSAGNLYIADGDTVRKVSNGVITTVAGNGTEGFSGDNGPATSAELFGPVGVAVDSAGNLYIADTLNNRIRKVSNGVITTVVGNGTYGFSGDGGPATSAQLAGFTGIAVDSAGNLFIATGNRIRKVSNGVITTVAGSGTTSGLNGFSGDNGPATSAQLNQPSGMAVDSGGNLFIADAQNWRIRKVSNGVITTVAGNGTPGFSGDGGPATSAQLFGLGGLAVDSAGNVYVPDGIDDRIRLLTASGPSCSASVSPTTFSPVASGGNIAVAIQTTSSCAWAVQSLPQWITYSGKAVGTGQATITLAVATNPGGARSAIISIAGVSAVVSQTGVPGASPSIAAVTNGASNQTGPIAPGEIIVIYGLGLGPAQITQAHLGDDGRFGTQLAGTSVQFNGIPAPMIYTWATQVAAIAPYAIGGGTAQVTVTYQSQPSAAVSVPIASSAPGVFSLDSSGTGQAAAINQDGFTSNTAANPAKIGDVISLYATGEGQTTPSGVDGKPASVPLPQPNLPVTVTIGGQTVKPQYAGGAPGEVAGVMQINAQIPSGIQTGNAVPVVVLVGGIPSQAGVTIAVH